MSEDQGFVHMLRSLSRYSQYSVNRMTYARAAETIERLEHENAALRMEVRDLEGVLMAEREKQKGLVIV